MFHRFDSNLNKWVPIPTAVWMSFRKRKYVHVVNLNIKIDTGSPQFTKYFEISKV